MLAVVFLLLFALFGELTWAHPVSPASPHSRRAQSKHRHHARKKDCTDDDWWPSSTLVYRTSLTGAIGDVEVTGSPSRVGGRPSWGQGQWLTESRLVSSGGDPSATATGGGIVALAAATDAPSGDVVVITKTVHVTVHATAASSITAQAVTTTKASEDIVAVGLEVDSSGHTSTLDVAPTSSKSSSAPQSTATASDSSDGTNPQDWVDLHNAARAKYGADPVVWDEDLAKVAKEHAEACNAAHTKAAENLQWGGGFGTPKGAVDAWMSEDALYNWANPVYSDATGHFTQIVWKDTKKIGCYIAKCPVNTVQPASVAESFQTACEYDPAGNFVNEGAFAANVGAAAS